MKWIGFGSFGPFPESGEFQGELYWSQYNLSLSVSGGLDETGHLYLCCPAVFTPDMGDDWTGAEYETGEATENLWASRYEPELSALLPFRAFDRRGDLMSLWPRVHTGFCRGRDCPHLTWKEWQSGKW